MLLCDLGLSALRRVCGKFRGTPTHRGGVCVGAAILFVGSVTVSSGRRVGGERRREVGRGLEVATGLSIMCGRKLRGELSGHGVRGIRIRGETLRHHAGVGSRVGRSRVFLLGAVRVGLFKMLGLLGTAIQMLLVATTAVVVGVATSLLYGRFSAHVQRSPMLMPSSRGMELMVQMHMMMRRGRGSWVVREMIHVGGRIARLWLLRVALLVSSASCCLRLLW